MKKELSSIPLIFFLSLTACNKDETKNATGPQVLKPADNSPTDPNPGKTEPDVKGIPPHRGQGTAKPKDKTSNSKDQDSPSPQSSDPVAGDLRRRLVNAVNEKNPLPDNIEDYDFECTSYLLNDGSTQTYRMRFAKVGQYFQMRGGSFFSGITFVKSANKAALKGVKGLYWRGFPTSNKWTMYLLIEKDGTFLGTVSNDAGPLIGGGAHYIDTCSAKSLKPGNQIDPNDQ